MSGWPGYEAEGWCPLPFYPTLVPPQGPNLQGVDATLALVSPSDTGVSTPLGNAVGGRIQRTGDTMSGRLLLGMGPPVSSLEAACKAYVDTQILLALTGAPPGSTLDLVFTNPGSSATPTTPIVVNFSPTADRGAGGYTAFSAAVFGGTVSQNPDSSGNRFNSVLNSTQFTVQATANGNIGHSALGTAVTKLLPKQSSGATYAMAGTDVLPAVWALYGTAEDNSQLPSSIGGPVAHAEFDMFIGAADNQGTRGGFTCNVDLATGLGSGGLPGTAAQGFYAYALSDFGLATAWLWSGFRCGGNVIMSGHDTRAVSGPGTTISAASSGTVVHVANVTPYLIGSNLTGTGVQLPVATLPVLTTTGTTTVAFAPGFTASITAGAYVQGTNVANGTTVVSANSTTGIVVLSQAPSGGLVAGTEITFLAANPIYNVQIGAGTYQVNNAVQDGAGLTSGVLTLSSALQGTDGAVGNAVTRPFYSLIMATGQAIGFDYNGNCRMSYSTTAVGGSQGLLLTGNLQVNAFQASSIMATGNITTSGAFSAAGASQLASLEVLGALTANDGLDVVGGFFNFSVFYAGTPPSGGAVLPNAGLCPKGGAIWIGDACKPGEASGSGTGVIAIPNGSGTAWLRASDYAAITH